MWMDALKAENLLAQVQQQAYSYIGPSLTEAVYRKGTIGRDDLEATATITDSLADINGKAYVSVNKASNTSKFSYTCIPVYFFII
jgi:enoyl-[acyl-carrier protein] reductase/trans-2-enoyl-CoA reductase (NAD+)